MNATNNEETIKQIFRKLTRESQLRLITLAETALIAEQSATDQPENEKVR